MEVIVQEFEELVVLLGEVGEVDEKPEMVQIFSCQCDFHRFFSLDGQGILLGKDYCVILVSP